MSTALLFFILALAFASFSFLPQSDALSLNKVKGCHGESCPELENCQHGVVTSKTGYSMCARGPGERCGGNNFPLHGDCGDGMFCYCGRCMGCSTTTYTCYDAICFK